MNRHSESLACSKEEVEQHLHDTFSEAVITPPEPTKAFDLREPLLKEVQEVVRKARSRSAL